MKAALLAAYTFLLSRITRSYLRRFKPVVVVVAGSIGKTSTTQAVSTLLSEKYRVRTTIKNYNTGHAVPMSVFAEEFPASTFGWLMLIPRLWLRARQRQDFEALVLEIGTDHPGELKQFAYLKPDIGLVTAVTPEHMEWFKTLDAVAAEELSISRFCKDVFVNADMVLLNYRWRFAPRALLFGGDAATRIAASKLVDGHQIIDLALPDILLKDIRTHLLGDQSLQAVTGAAAVALQLGLSPQQIKTGIETLRPVHGRMQLLQGIQDSKIIDDTYNSSPEAAIAALQTLRQLPGKQKIAVLGSMNELGDTSPEAHKTIGLTCRPEFLDLLITIGADASRYTAEAARQNGCKVITTTSPYAAGELLRQNLRPNAAVLVKGSQNKVFAEEAIKPILADPADSVQLVRQSPYWMKRKQRQFPDAPA